MKPTIKQLLTEHSEASFPDDCRGDEIEGIDLILLDADAAGCIISFVRNDGNLDLWRTAVLGLCYRDLTIVVRSLEDYAQDYFQRLETLSRLVLEDVIRRARAKDRNQPT